jgi:dsRNA-specific ribonuclease
MNFEHEKSKEFLIFIRNLLNMSEIGEKYKDKLTDDNCMKEFTKAFTHKSVNATDNYEYYETLGDVTTNKIVVWYYHRRFPELFDNPGTGNMAPVAVMARLKQNGISKKTYAKFAGGLNFWEFVRVKEEYIKDRTRILEDTFESFIGCLEYLIDKKFMDHSGYGIAYIFMAKIMDKETISLERDALYDSKSKLNEDINRFKGALTIEYKSTDRAYGNPSFLENKSNIPSRFETRILIFDKRNNKGYRSQPGYGASKTTAEQAAAKNVRDSKLIESL